MSQGINTRTLILGSGLLTATGDSLYLNGVPIGGGGSIPGVPQDVVYLSGNQTITGEKTFIDVTTVENDATFLGNTSVGSYAKLGRFHVQGAGLGEFKDDVIEIVVIHNTNDNDGYVVFDSYRHTSGQGWANASNRIRMITDATVQGEIEFNGYDNAGGIGLKTLNGIQRFIVKEGGRFGFNTGAPDATIHAIASDSLGTGIGDNVTHTILETPVISDIYPKTKLLFYTARLNVEDTGNGFPWTSNVIQHENGILVDIPYIAFERQYVQCISLGKDFYNTGVEPTFHIDPYYNFVSVGELPYDTANYDKLYIGDTSLGTTGRVTIGMNLNGSYWRMGAYGGYKQANFPSFQIVKLASGNDEYGTSFFTINNSGNIGLNCNNPIVGLHYSGNAVMGTGIWSAVTGVIIDLPISFTGTPYNRLSLYTVRHTQEDLSEDDYGNVATVLQHETPNVDGYAYIAFNRNQENSISFGQNYFAQDGMFQLRKESTFTIHLFNDTATIGGQHATNTTLTIQDRRENLDNPSATIGFYENSIDENFFRIGLFTGYNGANFPSFQIDPSGATIFEPDGNSVFTINRNNGFIGIKNHNPSHQLSVSGQVRFNTYSGGPLYVDTTGLITTNAPAIAVQNWSNPFTCNFGGVNKRIKASITGNTVFTGANMADGKDLKIFISGNHSIDVTLGFPSGWAFMGTKPTSLGSGKKAILSLECIGSNEIDVYAAWGVQQ